MLSEATSALLNTLTYRADARVGFSWMPLGGIFWEDELPDHNQFLLKIPDDDQRHIIRLFGIRVRLWNGQTLRNEDQQFWDATQSLVPRWAFFERLSVSADELYKQEEMAKQAEEVYEALFADADEVEITEQDGVQNFCATFDLYKNHDAVQEINLCGNVSYAACAQQKASLSCRNIAIAPTTPSNAHFTNPPDPAPSDPDDNAIDQ